MSLERRCREAAHAFGGGIRNKRSDTPATYCKSAGAWIHTAVNARLSMLRLPHQQDLPSQRGKAVVIPINPRLTQVRYVSGGGCLFPTPFKSEGHRVQIARIVGDCFTWEGRPCTVGSLDRSIGVQRRARWDLFRMNSNPVP